MAEETEAFQFFLSLLGPAPDAAAAAYENLRLRLYYFFESRGCQPFSDDLVDETIDRTARKYFHEEALRSIEVLRYARGVANNIAMAHKRGERKMHPIEGDVPAQKSVEPSEIELFLEECLRFLPSEGRDLLLRYYSKSGQANIDERVRMASEIGIAQGALRIRIMRIRQKLKDCIDAKKQQRQIGVTQRRQTTQ